LRFLSESRWTEEARVLPIKKNKLKNIVISLLGDSLKPLRIELALFDWSTVVGLTLADGIVDVLVPAELPALVTVEAIGATGLEVFSPEVLEPVLPGALLPDPLLTDPLIPEPPLLPEPPLPPEFPPLLGDPPLVVAEVIGTEVLLVKVWVRVHGQLVIVKVVG
jgi:hypothetical protein